MDPITSAIEQFRKAFRAFRADPEARVLRIVTDPTNTGTLTKALRAEEWNLDNRSPFLIFDTAFTRDDETFDSMRRALVDHHRLLKEALDEDGLSIPDLDLPATGDRPIAIFLNHLKHFAGGAEDRLEVPVVCWLPTDVQDERGFQQAVVDLIRFAPDPALRLVVSDPPDRERLAAPLAPLGDALVGVPFEVDEAGLRDFFKQMMSAPSKGRAPGTLPGAAAPDVEPPPRRGPQPPSEEEVRAAREEGRIPPVLTASEGDRLRRLVFEAAEAAGEGREEVALQQQFAACALCGEVGVKLEQAMMTTVLASYLIQFGREADAERTYHVAAGLAEEAGAQAQVAQVKMGLGYLLLKNRRLEEAARVYEEAAEAGAKGDATLLFIDMQRIAGVCYQQLGREQETLRCWSAAVEKGREASADEIRFSSFQRVGTDLLALLDRHRMRDEARELRSLLHEVGAKFKP